METIHIPTNTIISVNRTLLLRQWWYLYLHLLKKDMPSALEELDVVSKECERRGIIKVGIPMPRDGAEDLAKQVDEFKRRGK